MIIFRVELHSAITGQVTELARAHISNIGGSTNVGEYEIKTVRGRDRQALGRHIMQRQGVVRGHRRLDEHVWNLIGRALLAVGYVR